MGILDRLFSKRTDRQAKNPSLQVACVFVCDIVDDNEAVLMQALSEILKTNPGQLVGQPKITIAPKAKTSTITVTTRVRDQDEAFTFQRAGEIVLRRYRLQS